MSSIELTPDNAKFIESLIDSGKSSSMGQALNMAVDLLKRKVEISDAVQLGTEQADRGELLTGNEVFDRIEKRAAQLQRNSCER